MNEQAAQALYEAERKGVRQITGAASDGRGGRCAIGVLDDADIVLSATVSGCSFLCGKTGIHHGWAGILNLTSENDLVVHLNERAQAHVQRDRPQARAGRGVNREPSQ